jgi:cell division protein FtsW
MKNRISSFFSGFHKPLLFALVALCLFGILAVYNSSIVIAFRDFNDQFHFVRSQLISLLIGTIAFIITSTLTYKIWYRMAVPLLIFTIMLLLAVFIPQVGLHLKGAKRWIDLGFFTIQPTEFTKLSLVIYLSAWFCYKERKRFLPFLLLLGIVVSLVILQPDLGTAIIITMIAIVLYYISGAPWWNFALLVPVFLVGLVLLAIVAPYRFARITTFLDPNQDPLGSSYHVRQVLVAVGSGGWFGLGLGKSRQKYGYLPEANTDSIFAIIAEETGFVGASTLITVFALISYYIFRIAAQSPDKFGQLLCTGIGIWFTIQTLLNLASMVVLVPLTGVPLPLISYGGSNLISLLTAMGIVFNIGKHGLLKQKKTKYY